MMLEMGDDDPVAGFQQWPRKTLRDQIDRLCRAACKDDLAPAPRIDKADDVIAGAFVGLCRTVAQGMHATVHVRMIVALVFGDRVDDHGRRLRGGGAVEIDEPVPADLLV